jgi:hypothetical protein
MLAVLEDAIVTFQKNATDRSKIDRVMFNPKNSVQHRK